jgi:hypothetical protein
VFCVVLCRSLFVFSEVCVAQCLVFCRSLFVFSGVCIAQLIYPYDEKTLNETDESLFCKTMKHRRLNTHSLFCPWTYFEISLTFISPKPSDVQLLSTRHVTKVHLLQKFRDPPKVNPCTVSSLLQNVNMQNKISNFILQIGTWQITDQTWVKKV